MAVWSSLASKNIGKLDIAKKLIASLTNGRRGKGVNYVPVRNSHERTIQIKPSPFGAFKFKDMCYFYLLIGIIPLVSIALYANIFIGPATLALIPEGYEPEHWEYYRHPITRFMAKHITYSRQELYERSMHSIFFGKEKQMIRELEAKIKNKIRDRQDYQSWYFEKPVTKYARKMKEISEESENVSGQSAGWQL